MDLSRRESWNQRYAEGTTGWDLGAEAHALRALLEGLPQAPRRVLVPGAGYGHDAIAWAQHGAEVTAVDFAPLAIAGLRARAQEADVSVQAVESDLFALSDGFTARFDVVWEQTCLCAIDPARRGEYVETMHRVLAPGGTLYALLWNHGRPEGPPFDLPPALARELFESRFEIVSTDAVKGGKRSGEYLMMLTKR
jgi:SAM-dependent methyltransferase